MQSLSSKKRSGNRSLLSNVGSFSSCASPLLAKGRKQLNLASPDSVHCTPPPVLSLTPTLRASLNWRNSSASEHSSIVDHIRRTSRTSGFSVGSRRQSAAETDESTFYPSDGDIMGLAEKDLYSNMPVQYPGRVSQERRSPLSRDITKSAKLSSRRRASEQVMTLQQISEVSSPAVPGSRRFSQPDNITQGIIPPEDDNDNDTPHLFRTREMIQKSYAALHLKNMREGSFEDSDGSESSFPVESDDEPVAYKVSDSNTTFESIEIQRHQQESCSSPGMLNLTNVTKLCFSPDSSSDSEPVTGGQKRPFRYVDKSPILSTTSSHQSSGLTMEINAVSLGDEHRLKRKSMSHLEVPQFLSSPASRASENTERSAVLSSSCYSDSCSSQKSVSPVPPRWPTVDCTLNPRQDTDNSDDDEDDEDDDDKCNVTVLSTCSSTSDGNLCDGNTIAEPDTPLESESDGHELDRYIAHVERRLRTVSNSSESSKGRSLRSSCPELDMSVHNLSLEENSCSGEEQRASPCGERQRHDSRSGTDDDGGKTSKGKRRSSSLQDLKKAQKELEDAEASKGMTCMDKPRTKFANVKKVTRFMSLPSSMSSGAGSVQTPKMARLCHRVSYILSQ